MTTIYFVRHAEPNYENHNDSKRELSAKGLEDRKFVSEYLSDKNIDVVISSPYKRAVDTVKHFADSKYMQIELIDDFKERRGASEWIENFNKFSEDQWSDFSYKLTDGESLQEVQDRNISALKSVLKQHKDKTIVIGSHGTALSTIVNYYDRAFGYNDFSKIKSLMPLIVKFVFKEDELQSVEKINIFETR